MMYTVWRESVEREREREREQKNQQYMISTVLVLKCTLQTWVGVLLFAKITYGVLKSGKEAEAFLLVKPPPPFSNLLPMLLLLLLRTTLLPHSLTLH